MRQCVRWGLLGLGLAGCSESATPNGGIEDAAAVATDARPAADVGDTGDDRDAAVSRSDAVIDAAVGDAGPPAGPLGCNSAYGPYVREVPEGLTTLAWDDGEGVGHVAEQTWSVVGEAIAQADLYEAVRFDLPHPARVHAISVRYGRLPARAIEPVVLGLFADFGHNGFDFWAPAPLFEGSRCRGDLVEGEWATFTLPEPVEVAHPGLVYVAHRRDYLDAPAWQFDGTPPTPDCGDNCCAPFAACHSAWNLPTLKNFTAGGARQYAYNGLSLTFQYDYLVRLHVEYTEQRTADDSRFEAVPEIAPAHRMAWGDYDADGWPDLITAGPRLWHNTQGTFEDRTEASGLADVPGLSGSGIWGDFDNDGCPDLFVFEEAYDKPHRLLRNACDGTFADVTEAAGLQNLTEIRCGGPETTHAPSAAAAWADLDGDGLLDLYVSSFICWASGITYPDAVWRNQGDGTFAPWGAPFGEAALAGRNVAPIDHDLDGNVDVLVGNYRLHPNLFYRNDGEGVFTEAGRATRLAGRVGLFGRSENFGHTIGTAWGDVNEDGRFDVIQANLAHPRFFDFSSKTEVLLGQADGTYLDNQGDWSVPVGGAGLRYAETHSVPVLADFDNDGHLDLSISAVYEGRPTDFYWGRGDGTFELDAYGAGLTVTDGWGMATADFDRDGHTDLATKGVLFRNRGAQGGQAPRGAGNALEVALVGDAPGTNRMGLGASVRVHAGGRVWLRHVSGGDGQGGQASPYLHVGLGELAEADQVEVRFPGQSWQTFEGPFATGTRHWLFASGRAQSGWDPPAR